jgi:hypothetical protein
MQLSPVPNSDRSLALPHSPAARLSTHHIPSTPQQSAADRLTRSPDHVAFSAALVSGANAPSARLATDAHPTTPLAAAQIRLAGAHTPSAIHRAAKAQTPEDAAASRLALNLSEPFLRGSLERTLRGTGQDASTHGTTPPAARAPDHPTPPPTLASRDQIAPGDAATGTFWAFLVSANRDDQPSVRDAQHIEPGSSAGTSAFGREAEASQEPRACASSSAEHDARLSPATQHAAPEIHASRPETVPTIVLAQRYFAPSPRWGLIDVVA